MRLRLALTLVALACAATLACGGSPPQSAAAGSGPAPEPAAAGRAEPRERTGARAADARAAARRDLGRDESRGGHTLARHVGKSDEDLANRLRREPSIGAASTWADRETAERVVGATLEHARAEISRWAARWGSRPNLALDWRGTQPVGRSLRRGSRAAGAAACANVVLRWSARDDDYYVLTSYPEACR